MEITFRGMATSEPIQNEILEEETFEEQNNEAENNDVNEEAYRLAAEFEAEQQQQEEEVATTKPTKTPKKDSGQRKPYRFISQLAPKKGSTTQILKNPEIQDFFKGRENNPNQYFYTPEGNLEIKGVKNIPNKVIQIRHHFEPLTEPQLVELWNAREEALKEKERAFGAAQVNLRIALEQYAEDGSQTAAELVVQANESVRRAEAERTAVAYPERWVDLLQNPVIQDILIMYEPYEKRKMGYDVAMLKHFDLPMNTAWGTYVEGPASGGAVEENNLRIYFITDINDEKTGHFHPYTQRNFKFNETEYCCPYQAFEGERFKQLGKEDLRKQVLGTRSGRTIHSIAVKDKTMINAPQQLWEDILFQFFYQHPDFRKELDATGIDKFHVMDKEVPAEYGSALEKARIRLRELGDKDLDHQEAKEKVITEEEQQKAKVGAIIHNFRKKF